MENRSHPKRGDRQLSFNTVIGYPPPTATGRLRPKPTRDAPAIGTGGSTPHALQPTQNGCDSHVVELVI